MQGKRAIQGLIGATLVTLATASGMTGCASSPSGVVYIRTAPPPPEMEAIAAAPGDGYVWIAGHYVFRGNVYIWVPGRWERPPHKHARWESGRWEQSSQGWFWVEGRWN